MWRQQAWVFKAISAVLFLKQNSGFLFFNREEGNAKSIIAPFPPPLLKL